MSSETALLTFSIGPVHAFIAQARRVADLWAGSDLLSHLIRGAIGVLHRRGDSAMLFPFVERGEPIPWGLPNRFVCRVPRSQAEEVAEAMEAHVRGEWDRLVRDTVEILTGEPYGFEIPPWIWAPEPRAGAERQTDALLEIAWSWVPEKEGGYAGASIEGARQFIASRRFRPWVQIHERKEKCAVCGERTALPDGDRNRVRESWKQAEEVVPEQDQGFFRLDQTRLCLVCATKRLYPKFVRRRVRFRAFDHFEPKPEEKSEDGATEEPRREERDPYFALVAMDGDKMGDILGWRGEEVAGGDVEAFHRAVSKVLTGFARDLRQGGSQALNLESLKHDGEESFECAGEPPQLIYAGGEDVLFVADPRDALPLALRIRELYRRRFREVVPLLADPARYDDFTISAGILYAHTKHPAGLLFRDVQSLLDEKAKAEAGRDAVALRLVKRGGVPVEVAFKWRAAENGEEAWVERFNRVIELVRSEDLASRQTFNLRREETILSAVFETREQWIAWLSDRLSRGDASAEVAEELAAELAPFFEKGKAPALRIARFLGREVPA